MENNQNLHTVVALGNFDGFHIGHMAVVNKAKKLADKFRCEPVVATFKEHPLKTLKGQAPYELTNGQIKEDVMNSLGLRIEKIDFPEIMNMTPEEFFKKIIIEKFNAIGVCCGYNYHFGKNASGDTELLKRLCENFDMECAVIDAATFKQLPVSSTRIRNALKDGNIEEANAMLGRPFSYKERVVDGDKRGRLLGFPTINQHMPRRIVIPKFGVYFSETVIDEKVYKSVTNIGLRPTVDGKKVSSETHILDFNGNLYGDFVEVRLISYMREEKRFENLDELKAQISKDRNYAYKV